MSGRFGWVGLLASFFFFPLAGLHLDVVGALLTKRAPPFALPTATIFDDNDIKDYQQLMILERVRLL